MAYNLPPPWDPGFAMPSNALDEGLERRAFVTKWMPRGTYDAPRVGDGGYVVPQYVKDEGYGQGAIVTKWMPRGTYNGPRIPQWIQRQPTVVGQRSLGPRAAQVTIQRRAHSAMAGLDAAEGESPMPALFADYGQRAAAAILARINQLAPAERKAQLRKLMDAVDPSLWNRTAAITRRYVARGLAASVAFHQALAQALAAGIAAEMITAGASRTAPQPRSLLGLGCYGCAAALGAVDRSGMVFTGTTASTVQAAPNVRTAYAPCGNLPPGKGIIVGDAFCFPSDTKTNFAVEFGSPAQLAALPAVQRDLIKSALLRGAGEKGPIHPNNMQAYDPRACPYLEAVGIKCYQTIGMEMFSQGLTPSGNDIYDGKVAPIAKFKHPISNNEWGIFLAVPGDRSRFYIIYQWIPDASRWHRATQWIKNLPAKVAGAIGDALEELGELACKLAQNPNVVAAGGAAGMAAGGPAGAQAGAAGAQIASSLCGPGAVPPGVMPLPLPADSGLLPLAILGGGAILAIVLLTKKKKASP